MKQPGIQIRIPKPCRESWEQMDATGRGAFCKSCQTEVIDFSTMTDREVIEYLEKSKTGCGRFRKDQVDTKLTVAVADNGIFSWRRFLLALLPLLAVKSADAIMSKPSYNVMERTSAEACDSNSVSVPKPDQIRISGKVSDQKGEGLIGSSVILLDSSDNLTGIGAATDFDGNFDFSFDRARYSPSYHLKIQCAGYNSKRHSVSDTSLQIFTVKLDLKSDPVSRELIMGKFEDPRNKSWFKRTFGRKPKHQER